MRAIVVIPARYQSGRLPGKPLIDLCGQSLIQRTYGRCITDFPRDSVYVATDDERVFSHCRKLGMQTIMTSTSCMTGTDRVAEVATLVEADFYINVQGDEPLFNSHDIIMMLQAASAYPGEVLNGFAAIKQDEDFRRSSIPKVVMRPDGRLLYMSRAPIPITKKNEFVRAHRQICIYGFTPQSLHDFKQASSKTSLESVEDIEILRFLELGYDVRMIELSDESVSVDTPEDVQRVINILNSGISAQSQG